jgi:hypothetical protein
MAAAYSVSKTMVVHYGYQTPCAASLLAGAEPKVCGERIFIFVQQQTLVNLKNAWTLPAANITENQRCIT